MKLWTKLGLAGLALAMIAALVFAQTPKVLAFDAVCSDIEDACNSDCGGDSFCFALCMFDAVGEEGYDCNVCPLVDPFCNEVCDGDPDCLTECTILLPLEVGFTCSSNTCGGGPSCATACAGPDQCEAACDAASSCDPNVACQGPSECLAYCQAGGFATGGDSCTCGDDRVNTNCSAPEIVYCNGADADFYAYNYVTLEGDFDFEISLADLRQSVEEKTLIKQDGTVKVYLMPDGRVLLVARQPDGKDYFMYWNPNTCTSLEESAQWNVQ